MIRTSPWHVRSRSSIEAKVISWSSNWSHPTNVSNWKNLFDNWSTNGIQNKRVHASSRLAIIENSRRVDISWIVETGLRSLSKKMRSIPAPVHLFLLTYSSRAYSLPEFIGKLNREKQLSVNKIGHALHTLEPQFKKVSFSDKIKVETSLLGSNVSSMPSLCQDDRSWLAFCPTSHLSVNVYLQTTVDRSQG